ncbi:MAG: short-chain fatty acid transporter [Deferribacterota bacterium]|nr:short-chain fatty acid transporter [Deferribacterota bacterium]
MISKISGFFVKLVQRYLPDPFIFAVVLTFVVFIMGILINKQSPMNMIIYWGNGFWNLLAFSMQMILILVTGFVLANTPLLKNLLRSVAKAMKNPTQAIMVTTLVGSIASWINWGFGLVIGALIAKEMAKTIKGVDYRLLIASGYIGFLVWHAGLSGSIPLTIATPGHFLEDQMGIIQTSETIFSTFNLITMIILIITLPFLTRLMVPPKYDTFEIPTKILDAEKEDGFEIVKNTPADRLENSTTISMLIGIMGFVYIVYYFGTNGFKLNLNIVNFIFLFFGILLHKTPKSYLISLHNAVKGAGGIILQFPFYSGIMGMMVASGLAATISGWFVSISSETTLPFFTFLSAGLVNFFVPSGGGQWAVQGPIMVPASVELGVPLAKTAMAVAWGDAWTNMIQPFWALPALGIAGLGAKDIMGYCLVALIYSGIIVSLCFLIL